MINFEKIKNPEELLTFMDKNIYYGFVSKKTKKIYTYAEKKYNDVFVSNKIKKIHTYSEKKYNDLWSKEYFLQSPKSLLKFKYGICWDYVELERYWFERNKYEIKTYLLIFNIKEKNNYPTHSFLTFKKDNKWYWFENSWLELKGIHEYNFLEELIEDIKIRFLETIEMDINIEEKKNILKCFEYSKPNYNIDIKEFINHTTKNI